MHLLQPIPPPLVGRYPQRVAPACCCLHVPTFSNHSPCAPPPPSPPTCRYGDLEAIEDYMAIGKGALADSEQRTALHYAVAYDKPDALQVRA